MDRVVQLREWEVILTIILTKFPAILTQTKGEGLQESLGKIFIQLPCAQVQLTEIVI